MKGSMLLSLLVLALSGSAEAQFWKDWFKPKHYKTTSTSTTSTYTSTVSYYHTPSITTFYSSYFYRYPTGTTYLPPPTFTPVVYYTPQPSCGTSSQSPLFTSTAAPYYVPVATSSAQVIYPTPQAPSYTPHVPVATPTPSLVYYGVNQPYYPYAPTNTSGPVYQPIYSPVQPSVCATPTLVFTSPICVATPTPSVIYYSPQPSIHHQPPIYVPPQQPQPSVYPQPPVQPQPPVYPQPPVQHPIYPPQPPPYQPQPQPPVYQPQPPIYRPQPQPPIYRPQPQPPYQPQPPGYPQPPVYHPRPPMPPVCPQPPPFYPRPPVHPRPPIHRPRPLPHFPPTFPGHPMPPAHFPAHPQMPMRPFVKRRQLVCVNYRKVYTGLRLCKIRKLCITNPIAIPVYVELLTQYFIAKKCHPSWNRRMCRRACLNFVAIEIQRKGVHGGWREAFEHSFRLESSAALPSKFYNPIKAKRHMAAFQHISVHQCSAMPVHNIGQLIEYLKTIARFNLMQAPGQPIGLLLQKTQTIVQQEAASKGPIAQYAQAFIRSVCLKEWKAMKAAQRLH